MSNTPALIAREGELDQLDTFLDHALAGQGQVCFVTGDAGIGKSTLVTEFARQTQEQHTDLIIATGLCDPQTGVGAPYLPFREMLGVLTGTRQTRQAEEQSTQENDQRLKGMLRTSTELLVDYGPDLIGLFVPGAALAARVTKMGISVSEAMEIPIAPVEEVPLPEPEAPHLESGAPIETLPPGRWLGALLSYDAIALGSGLTNITTNRKNLSNWRQPFDKSSDFAPTTVGVIFGGEKPTTLKRGD